MELFQKEFEKIVSQPSTRKNIHFNLQTIPRSIVYQPLRPVKHVPKDETMEAFRTRLIIRIAQMMYVSGETAEPSHETTGMVEEIVRQQVIEMVSESSIYNIRSATARLYIMYS